MQEVKVKISKEDYDKYMAMPYAEFRKLIQKDIPDAWSMGYGWYGCKPREYDGEYFLVHTIGSSCD